MLHTMDGLDVASDLVDELRKLLQVHCGPVLGVLHILNALQQHTLELSLTLLWQMLPDHYSSLSAELDCTCAISVNSIAV